ncbi:MAG TPA: hypothetical protein VEA38_16455 [Terriglobales bacterium]|nr:hypothetical protein [Terriglobales bacterium]
MTARNTKPAAPARLAVGDLVVRRHRLLKTRGTVIRTGESHIERGPRVWVQWDHPDTFPNPSLEPAEELELVAPSQS